MIQRLPKGTFPNFFPEEYIVAGVCEGTKRYEFLLMTRNSGGVCPKCGYASKRVHGHQDRLVRDLPILGKGVVLNITQTKYFCDNEECEAEIFTESNELVGRHGQFTKRCREYMLKVATHMSGEAAAKILAYQGIRVTGDTLLNMMREAGAKYEAQVGKNIGVDDWSYRKGEKYGTLICDLDTHEIIEVLEGRDSETFKKWLIAHPGVEIVSRDRSSEYASAVKAANPETVQIADRFHITKNLLEALEETLKGYLPEAIQIPVPSSGRAKGTEATAEKAEADVGGQSEANVPPDDERSAIVPMPVDVNENEMPAVKKTQKRRKGS